MKLIVARDQTLMVARPEAFRNLAQHGAQPLSASQARDRKFHGIADASQYGAVHCRSGGGIEQGCDQAVPGRPNTGRFTGRPCRTNLAFVTLRSCRTTLAFRAGLAVLPVGTSQPCRTTLTFRAGLAVLPVGTSQPCWTTLAFRAGLAILPVGTSQPCWTTLAFRAGLAILPVGTAFALGTS